jgi:ankyrin repeat protein
MEGGARTSSTGADVEGYTPLYVAAEKGDLVMVQCLVKRLGTNVNIVSQKGATPLHTAAQEGQWCGA